MIVAMLILTVMSEVVSYHANSLVSLLRWGYSAD